jgi:hypothetical protein
MLAEKISHKKDNLSRKIDSFSQDYFFDIQSVNPAAKLIDEQQIAKILTKLAVGSATVWWSILELKEMYLIHRSSKKG